MDGSLSVGQLARRAGLTAKALRHYDRIGLFSPAEVDAAGYRRYAWEQLGTARLIVRLHEIRHLLTDRGVTDVTDEPEILDHRRLAAALFNGTWELMEKEGRTPADDDRMLHMAHASRHHWGEVGTAANIVRGEWQCSRVYSVLRRPEPCLHHAHRALELCTEHGIGDWDLAFCHEALARGHAVAGDTEAARAEIERALAIEIAEDEDRNLLLADLETIPGVPRFW